MKREFQMIFLALILVGSGISCTNDLVLQDQTAMESTVVTRDYDTPLYTLPDGAVDVTTVSSLQYGTNYVITGTFDGELPTVDASGGSGIRLYVQGTWKVLNGVIPSDLEVVVLRGGTIQPYDEYDTILDVEVRTNISVLSGGTINLTNDMFSYLFFPADENSDYFLNNYGTVTVSNLQMNYTNLMNEVGATLNVLYSFDPPSSPAQLLNFGTILVNGSEYEDD